MTRQILATIQQIIEEARNGRMFVLVSTGRPGDVGMLVIPAQFAGADVITFMATHGRGIICLGLTPERVAALGLPPMTLKNSSHHQSAFTVSIEALTGISTGISSADRARTIQVAIDPASGAESIVTPGHVFPVEARQNGVLDRPGFTEASVDISRFAGLDPSGVMCAILGDGGDMAPIEELVSFAARHDLRIGSINDLVTYRCCTEELVDRLAAERLPTPNNDWELVYFRERLSGVQHLALINGEPGGRSNLVSLHHPSIKGDLLGVAGRGTVISDRMAELHKHGGGTLLVMTAVESDLTIAHPTGGPARRPGLERANAASQILRSLGLSTVTFLQPQAPDTLRMFMDNGLKVEEIDG